MIMKIAFAGTPEFAVPSLQALIGSDHEVVAVWTQPDRPAGRGKKLTPSPVKVLAESHGIEVYQPQSLRDSDAQQQMADLQLDLLVVAAYGLILPQAVLSLPQLGCINVHASILPQWRGAAPIQAAILAGDPETGVTIMQMDVGLDTGDMLLISKTAIGADETAGELTDRLAQIGASALTDALADLPRLQQQALKQDDKLSSHAGKITKQQALIDWQDAAEQISRQVRAYSPWPVAYTHLGDERLRLWQAQAVDQTTDAAPGTVIALNSEAMYVATGSGVLAVTELQMPGKRRQAVTDFLNAHQSLQQADIILR
ncbi:MAG: methionyl-tRNA formyltransferase [Coxiellaceae bacterium]|nr:methionyl-tRNA formyltransferase [Coxiellaceae bacterium]